MLEPEELELEEEQWHQKINHEDQGELFTAAPEVEPETPPEEIKDPGLESPLGAGADPKQPLIPPHGTEAPLHEVWIPRIRKFLENPTNRYATMAVGFGVLVGVIVAAISWYASNPDGRYDLGPVTSDAVGLRGRLFVKWDEKLHYRLVFEPSYPDQIPGFSLAAGNPPRPMSISIQLRDVQGFELCSKDVVLRFDTKRAEALAPVPRGGEAEAASSAAPAPTTALAPDAAADVALQAQQQAQLQAQQQAQQDATEAARQRGKDVFELQAGPSGQIVAINAQGDLPCSQSNYTSTTSWTFVPDFPSLAEQKELLKRLKEREEYTEKLATEAANPHKKKAKKPTANAVVFYIEGDDTIDDYDSAMGIISTRGRKTFSIDRSGAEAAALRNSDFPMGIHYRCDQMGNCAISSSRAGVLHGRLRR
jgi:hypothetical protein